jgi:hypothetical protein
MLSLSEKHPPGANAPSPFKGGIDFHHLVVPAALAWAAPKSSSTPQKKAEFRIFHWMNSDCSLALPILRGSFQIQRAVENPTLYC